MTKTFTIEFYQGILDGSDEFQTIADVLAHLATNHPCPVVHVAGFDYELRDIESINHGNVIRGKFAKIRHDDIPHAAAPHRPERELDLADDEGLLEKNYFQYHRGLRLLVWQANRNAASPQRFADYLSDVSGGMAQMLPVIRHDAMNKLRNGQLHIRKLDITVAAAANANNVAATDFSRSAMSLVAQSNGMPVSISLRGDGRSRDPARRFLDPLREAILDLIDSGSAQKAKVQFEDEQGGLDLVDFVADRLKSRQDVAMNGRYPDEQSMFIALERARGDHGDELRAILGN